jgi:hypothetical protein
MVTNRQRLGSHRSRLLESDDERLAYLFKEYERMIAEEQTKR